MILSALISQSAGAAEWQWSVPDGTARAYLWIPPHCQRVRAVVVANHNMIEQGILEHPTMRQTLSNLDIAEVWVVPYLDHVFDFNKGAGEHFEKLIKTLGEESGYSELEVAPIIPLGHSACATYPWNFAAWNPSRTLAILSVHGDAPQTSLTGYGGPNVDWKDRAIDGVPGLMVMGEYEWWDDRVAPAFTFMAKHPGVPMAFLADAGHGHFDYSDELVSFLSLFIRKAAELRLPGEAAINQAVRLTAVDPRAGWLIDRWNKDKPPTAPAAPYDKYTGDRTHAFWCFDREMAEVTEAYESRSLGKKPQLVGFIQNGKIFAGEPATPQFLPLDDGITFHLTAGFLDTVSGNGGNPARWAGMPNGSALGHAGDGKPVIITRIVGPIAQTGPDTFCLRLDRSVYTANGRNNDMWMLASHPGDDQYKSAVQQAMIRAIPNNNGIAQKIIFPAIGNQNTTAKSIKLAATADSGMPVYYYIRQGPAEVHGDTLEFLPIPPRSRFPVKVTVVAWQWGRASQPQIHTAIPIEQTFEIVPAN
jgi:hypothetical protein